MKTDENLLTLRTLSPGEFGLGKEDSHEKSRAVHEKKRCHLPLVEVLEEEKVILPLGRQRVKKLQRLVCHPVEITSKDGTCFSIVIKTLLNKLHEASDKKGEFFLIGGKCSDIIDNTNNSKDIDIHHMLPVDTPRKSLNRFLNFAKNYFVFTSGAQEHHLIDQKIIKIIINTRDDNLFYTLKFSDRWGMSYDISIVSKLARQCLFEHDVRKLPITSIVEAKNDIGVFEIVPINPLKTGIMPGVYRKKKLLDAPNPETINFPGCLRLFSYYVKGWRCLNHDLEKILTDSFVLQWKTNLKNDLKQSFRNIIRDHHDGSYAAAVVFAFNLLNAIEHYSHQDVYDKARGDCIDVLKGLTQQTLPKSLEKIEQALFAGISFSGIPLNNPIFPHDEQNGRIHYKIDDYYLVTSSTVSVILEPTDSITLQEKKGVICTSDLLVARLEEDHEGWNCVEICQLLDDLRLFCTHHKKLPIDLRKGIDKNLGKLLVIYAQKDMTGSLFFGFFPYCNSLFSMQLTEASFLLIRDRCETWIDDPGIDIKVLEMIYNCFFHNAENERRYRIAQVLVAKQSFLLAKEILDACIDESFISGDFCFDLIEGLTNENVIQKLKLYQIYQHHLLKALNSEAVKREVVNLIDAVLKKNIATVGHINMCMELACSFGIKDGQRWEVLLSKALNFSQKTKKRALYLFMEKIVPQDLLLEDVFVYIKCWRLVLRKMVKKHDDRLKALLVNQTPILKIKEANSSVDLRPVFELLIEEAFYCLDNASPEYQKYFELISVHGQGFFLKKFVTIYVSSPFVKHVLTACEKLRECIELFEFHEIKAVCEKIENRKCKASSEIIVSELEGIVLGLTRQSTPRESFLTVIALASTVCSIQGLIFTAAERYLQSCKNSKPDTILNVLEDVVTFVMSKNMRCGIDELMICGKLLAFKEFDLVEEVTYQEKLWMNRIVFNFRIAIEDCYNEKLLLNAFEFFFAHFHHLNALEASEHICLVFVARALKELYHRNLPLFIELKNRIACYLSDNEPTWLEIERNGNNPIPMPPITISSLESYQFYSQTEIGGNPVSTFYSPFSEQYVKDLQNTRDLKPAHWFRYGSAMCFICECILRTTSEEIEREEFLLSLTGELLEILLLGDAHRDQKTRGVQNDNLMIVLEIFLKRKGYPSLSLTIKQWATASHLFACAYQFNYIPHVSSDLFFYNLFLDLKLTQVLVKNPLYKIEGEIQKMVEWVVDQRSIYSFIRVLSIMTHLSKMSSITSLSGYHKKIIFPLKSGCQLMMKESTNLEELPLLKTIQRLINQL